MPPLQPYLRSLFLVASLLFLAAAPMAQAQEGPLPEAADPQQAGQSQQPPAPVTRQAAPTSAPPASNYDPAVFLKPIPPDGLRFIAQFDGAASSELFHDHDFRKLMKQFVPDCMFHYGRDMPLSDALDAVLSNSREPVVIRDGRYVLLSGARGPYLGGRGFLWIDLQQGIGLGGFYFRPTNGEPTPTLAVFSRQVREQTIALSQLPPAFVEDMNHWTTAEQIEPVTTRYLLTGGNKRILLEHDEDFCSLGDGTVASPGSGCEALNADAADVDETAAYYLDQIHYATNGTAWTIGGDQLAWIQLRSDTCGGVADPLGCRIRVTRQHTHLILGGGSGPHLPRR